MSEKDPKKRTSIFKRMGSAISKAFGGREQEDAMPKFEISEPYNFQHVRHVQIDPRTSTGFSVGF
jgi:P21-Rho-binding domain